MAWFRMRTKTSLRPATLADGSRMAAIHAAGFAVGWSKGEIERMLLDGHVGDTLLARGMFGEAVAGFAIGRVVLDEAELLTIALDPKWRGQHVASGLLQRHCQRLRQAGAATVFLEVAADNAPALALYRKAGFREMGRRTGYYPGAKGERRDAITMRLDISALDPTPRAY